MKIDKLYRYRMKGRGDNVTRIYAGINYIRKDGTSRASVFADELERDCPELKRIAGDFTKYKGKKIEKIALYAYEYDARGYSAKRPTVYRRYIIQN